MISKNRDKSALILEDDVDVEWDLQRLWSRIERRLPKDWDATLLGHCWGKELLRSFDFVWRLALTPQADSYNSLQQNLSTYILTFIARPFLSVFTPTPSLLLELDDSSPYS